MMNIISAYSHAVKRSVFIPNINLQISMGVTIILAMISMKEGSMLDVAFFNQKPKIILTPTDDPSFD